MVPIGAARGGVVSGGGAIPDSDLSHIWHAPAVSSIDPWTDELGNLDMSMFGSPTLGNNLNSNQAVDYDSGDYHATGTGPTIGANGEFTLVVVMDPLGFSDSADPFVSIGSGPGTDGVSIRDGSGGIDFISNGLGGGTTDMSVPNEPVVLVCTFDGSTLIIDVNGTESFSGSLPEPNDPTDASIGGYGDGGFTDKDAIVGSVGWEPTPADQTRRDELTNSFADAFDIAI